MWSYTDQIKDRSRLRIVTQKENCVFCGDEMDLREMGCWPVNPLEIYRRYEEKSLWHCKFCGWWIDHAMASREEGGRSIKLYAASAGLLKGLSGDDITQPLDEVRSFLNGGYQERFTIDPKRFENAVAAVFSGLGYRARVTGQRGDGGIDIILDGQDDRVIGVQVKRYRNVIEAAQIRELTGALVQRGLTKGIFVTTSEFSSGSVSSAALSHARGMPIDLMNANLFFDAMKIAAQPTFKRPRSSLTITHSVRKRSKVVKQTSLETRAIRMLKRKRGLQRVLAVTYLATFWATSKISSLVRPASAPPPE